MNRRLMYGGFCGDAWFREENRQRAIEACKIRTAQTGEPWEVRGMPSAGNDQAYDRPTFHLTSTWVAGTKPETCDR